MHRRADHHARPGRARAAPVRVLPRRRHRRRVRHHPHRRGAAALRGRAADPRPALDCPIQVRLVGDGHEQVIEVAGFRRLRLRPFDPGRDTLTEHEQTDARLLAMFGTLDSPEFDTEDARAFCRLFAACVRAAQVIMFEKTFMRGTRVTEGRVPRRAGTAAARRSRTRGPADPPGRRSRRLRRPAPRRRHRRAEGVPTARQSPSITAPATSASLPSTESGEAASSRCSSSSTTAARKRPPASSTTTSTGSRPRLHGLDDPRYPSLVGVLIINTNLPIPSAWSRRRSGSRAPHRRREPARLIRPFPLVEAGPASGTGRSSATYALRPCGGSGGGWQMRYLKVASTAQTRSMPRSAGGYVREN